MLTMFWASPAIVWGHCLTKYGNVWLIWQMSDKCCNFVAFVLLSCRWASLLWHWEGFPGVLAALLSHDEVHLQRTLGRMRTTWKVWQEARGRTETDVLAWCRQSYVGWVVVGDLR